MPAPWERYAQGQTAAASGAPWEKYRKPEKPPNQTEGFLARTWRGEIVEPAQQVYGGVLEGSADFYKMLSNAADLIGGDKPGQRQGLFQNIETGLRQQAEQLPPPQGTVQKIYRGVGSAIPAITKYALASRLPGGPAVGMGTAEAVTAADQGPAEAAKAGLLGAATGQTLKYIQPATLPTRVSGGAALFGGQAVAQGGDVSDVVSSAVTGGGLLAQGGRGTRFREARREVLPPLRPPAAQREAPAPVKQEPVPIIEPKAEPVLKTEQTMQETPVISTTERGSLAPRPLTPPKPKIEFPDVEVERRFQAAAEPEKPPSLIDKLRDAGTVLYEKSTRTYEHLPRGEQFGPAIFRLKQLEKAPSLASDKAIRTLAEITKGMDRADYDAFRKKVVMDDALENWKRFEAEGKTWEEMPFGLKSPDQLQELHGFITQATATTPVIQEALAKRKQTWNTLRTDLASSMKAAGFDVDNRLTREDYFHHRVLDHMQTRMGFGGQKRLRTPTGRGYLKQRKVNPLDYSTEYIESEYEVMAQMHADIQKAKTIAWVSASENKLNIASQLKQQATSVNAERKANGRPEVEWQSLVPQTHVLWQPREGSSFYLADTLSEKAARRVLESSTGDLVAPNELRKALAKGGRFRELAIPRELAETLNNLTPQHSYGERLLSGAQTKWKQYQLLSPFRYAKYNLRNLSGDAEPTFVGNRSAFTQVPKSTKDLYDFYSKGEISPEMQGWYERGGMQTLLQAQEMGELRKIDNLKNLFPGNERRLPSYWRGARISTDFREGILRYANYIDYLQQIRSNPQGRPKNFGASIPEEVMALRDPMDRAFKLSNDLLGAYDEISVTGQMLRRDLMPFWSFQELNMRRYMQMAKNAARDGELSRMAGRKLLGTAAFKAPYAAYRLGSFALKAGALWAALIAYNKTRYSDEWDELPDNVQARPTIILGRNEDGSVRYFSRLGALSDLVEWFGPEESAPTVRAWLNGERSVKEIASDTFWKNPVVNKLWQSLGPLSGKLPTELIAGKSTYPDISRPRTIRDRAEYALQQFPPFDEAYRRLKGKPTRKPLSQDLPAGLAELGKKALFYEIDRGQSSYYRVKDRLREFRKAILKEPISEGGYQNERTEALYNLRLAIRYGDKTAREKYLKLYLTMPSRDPADNIRRSLERMHPLSGLDTREQVAFVKWMDDEDREDLKHAIDFYNTTLLGNTAQRR